MEGTNPSVKGETDGEKEGEGSKISTGSGSG